MSQPNHSGQSTFDLSIMSLKDALDFAVLIEEEARDRYQELGDQLELHRTRDAAAFFLRMARIEEKHRSQLADRRRREFGFQPTSVTRDMLFDVEAPAYDTARAFMSVRQALDVALHAETKAHAFFNEALAVVTDASVRHLFEELRNEEAEHQQLVRGEIARLPPPHATDKAEAGDDPVAL